MEKQTENSHPKHHESRPSFKTSPGPSGVRNPSNMILVSAKSNIDMWMEEI